MKTSASSRRRLRPYEISRSVRGATRAANACLARGCRLGWIVPQPRAEPSFDFLQRHPLADMVVDGLVAAEFADCEVFGFRVREVQPAHAAAGPHGEAFSERHAGAPFHVEQLPENSLLRVVGTRGIACGWANAAVGLVDELFLGELFRARVAPLLPDSFVEEFREGLGKAVSLCLGHDGVIVVEPGFERVHEFLQPKA